MVVVRNAVPSHQFLPLFFLILVIFNYQSILLFFLLVIPKYRTFKEILVLPFVLRVHVGFRIDVFGVEKTLVSKRLLWSHEIYCLDTIDILEDFSVVSKLGLTLSILADSRHESLTFSAFENWPEHFFLLSIEIFVMSLQISEGQESLDVKLVFLVIIQNLVIFLRPILIECFSYLCEIFQKDIDKFLGVMISAEGVKQFEQI